MANPLLRLALGVEELGQQIDAISSGGKAQIDRGPGLNQQTCQFAIFGDQGLPQYPAAVAIQISPPIDQEADQLVLGTSPIELGTLGHQFQHRNRIIGGGVGIGPSREQDSGQFNGVFGQRHSLRFTGHVMQEGGPAKVRVFVVLVEIALRRRQFGMFGE